jgi:hypothetical protein
MPTILQFADAIGSIDGASKKHLLLGNGFSISLKPDIFSYDSLYENADFSKAPYLAALFKAIGTKDFEIVIRHMQDAATVLAVYDSTLSELVSKLKADAAVVKDALVSAIAKRHPDRPFDISPEHYAACRAFLVQFDHIFTLNYDVLLYWVLMQDEVDDLLLKPDDGFRHPEDDPNLPYVSWQQSQSATVHYLHGALHLFDQETEMIKYTWSKTDIPIVEQIRMALDENKFPLFVSEGTSASKRRKILHNAYLHKALRSFESCCGSSKNAIVIFGHSLAANDAHILGCITSGGVSNVVVGIHGNPASDSNQAIFARTEEMIATREKRRGKRFPLNITFYDSSSAHVWG